MNKMTSREQQIYQMLAVGGYGSRGENGALTDWDKRIFITIDPDQYPGRPVNVMVSFPFEEVVKKPEKFTIEFDNAGNLTEKGIDELTNVVAYCDMAKRSFQNDGRLYTREDALKLLDELTYKEDAPIDKSNGYEEDNVWEKSGRKYPDLVIEKKIGPNDITLAYWKDSGIYELTDKKSGRVAEFFDSKPNGELAYNLYKDNSYENGRRVGELIASGYSGFKPDDKERPMQYEMLHSNMSMFRMADKLFDWKDFTNPRSLFEEEVDTQIGKLDRIYGIKLVKKDIEPSRRSFERSYYLSMQYELSSGIHDVPEELKQEYLNTVKSYEEHRANAYDDFEFKSELENERATLQRLNNQIVAAENETKIRAAIRLEDEKEISWQEIKSELREKTFVHDHTHNEIDFPDFDKFNEAWDSISFEDGSNEDKDYISNDELVPEAEEDCASFEFG